MTEALTWKDRDDLMDKLIAIRESNQVIWFYDYCIKWEQDKEIWQEIDYKYFGSWLDTTMFGDQYTDETLADEIIESTGKWQSEYEISTK